MTEIEKQKEQLRLAHEKGFLDEKTYKDALKRLDAETASSEESDKTTNINDSQAGIVGDHATVHGDIYINTNGIDPEALLYRYLNDLAAETDILPWGQISPTDAGPEKGRKISVYPTSIRPSIPPNWNKSSARRMCGNV